MFEISLYKYHLKDYELDEIATSEASGPPQTIKIYRIGDT
jgi:hypothetical protein